MVNFEDFQENNKIDWVAYRKAKVAAGEECYQCGGFILFAKGVPALCISCQELDTSDQEVSHSKLIRCPKCKHASFVDEYSCDSRYIYDEGEHEVTCNNCNHQFSISTHVTYLFTSPAKEG